MNDFIHSVSPLLQMTTCASLVTAGSVIDQKQKVQKVDIIVEIEDKEVDIYRDTALRYAGYLNEIGEAFRPIIPSSIVALSYALAITYVLADAVSKGNDNIKRNGGTTSCGVAAALDTLLFQFIASIIFPGFVVNRWVAFCGYLTYDKLDVANRLSEQWHVDHNQVLTLVGSVAITPESIASSIPTALGLALIPAIIAPLDALTEMLLDRFIRPEILKAFPDCDMSFDECVKCNRSV